MDVHSFVRESQVTVCPWLQLLLTLAGDGIGSEIVSAAKECIAATGVDIDWVNMEMVSERAPERGGEGERGRGRERGREGERERVGEQ